MAIKGSEWVLVALLAGTFVSDPDKVPDRVRAVAKAVDQVNRLTDQAREALDTAVQQVQKDTGQPVERVFAPKEKKSDGLSLVDLAHRLGVKTEGRTADEIADDIARMAVDAASGTKGRAAPPDFAGIALAARSKILYCRRIGAWLMQKAAVRRLLTSFDLVGSLALVVVPLLGKTGPYIAFPGALGLVLAAASLYWNSGDLHTLLVGSSFHAFRRLRRVGRGILGNILQRR